MDPDLIMTESAIVSHFQGWQINKHPRPTLVVLVICHDPSHAAQHSLEIINNMEMGNNAENGEIHQHQQDDS